MTKKAFLSVLLALLMVFGGLPLAENLQVSKAAQAESAPALTGTVTDLWNFTTLYSTVFSPVVTDSFVYITSYSSGGAYSALYCIDATNGIQVWNKTGLFYRFAITNGYIYVSQGVPGAVSCLNASNGAQLWNYSYGNTFATPLVEKGVVYAGGKNYTRSTDISISFIYALDAMTGRKIWSFSGPVGTSFDWNSPVLAGSTLYAVSALYTNEDRFWNSGVYAFDASTGEKLWNYSTPGQFGSLVAGGQEVYVGCNFVNTTDITGGTVYGGGVLALNASDGTRIWDYPTGSSVHSPILVNNTVYAVSGDGYVCALSASDGKTNWNYSIGLRTSSPLLVDGYLYVGSSAGVYCFNASTGMVNWSFTDYFADSWGVTIADYTNGVIYVGWNDPQRSPVTYYFYALDALSGEWIWNYTIDGPVRSSPAVAGTTVYISTTYPIDENTYGRGGGVLALNSTVTALPPLPPFPFSTLFAAASLATIAAVGVGLLVYFKKRKR